ncbi:MAG TPA: hypothetical protein VK795_03025 [Terriglobales bacterium]|jgi:hypothetical protein|nr:hypothetical protein [Terriglobales bacterium]
MNLIRMILLVALPLISPGIGVACTCSPTSTSQMSFDQSDIVFQGELIDHKGNLAIFRVHDYWKGNLESLVAVEWRRGDRGDCDGFWLRDLKVGKDLLVFAKLGRDGVYRTSICLPTGPAADSRRIIQELGPGNHNPAKSDAAH